jgi:uncharacterized protein (DUF362 family)
MKSSRRQFLRTIGATTVGMLVAPYVKSANILTYGHQAGSLGLARVAITRGDNYSRSFVKQKVQDLLQAIGGIGDLVRAGDTVAIKINLTGGSGSATSSVLHGVSITESMWTHPEVLRAVGELLIDSGVRANDIYIVESLWDAASYNNFGYLDVQKSLGAQMVNLNAKDPYPGFIAKQVGNGKFYYSSFTMNQILADVNVYVSIPKMKHHYDAGLTCSLKNQVGAVPMQPYVMPNDNRRAKLHFEGGDISFHLPHSICDLNSARPVNLAVIDGIKNAKGGEGVWNATFRTAESHVLLAGKDPVATDSVAAYLMGLNPEAKKLPLPDGIRQCDNYLDLLHQKGIGTNQMSEIEIVGDGAGLVTSVRPERESTLPSDFQLFQNYPNPFNPSTVITFYLPRTESVSLRLYDVTGQEVETLMEGEVPAGIHEFRWKANGLASGVYVYQLHAGRFSDTKKMIYQK